MTYEVSSFYLGFWFYYILRLAADLVYNSQLFRNILWYTEIKVVALHLLMELIHEWEIALTFPC